ncbi:hypothetical protein JCM8547_006615 [Rhodosporidiobolus lusitaniae]
MSTIVAPPPQLQEKQRKTPQEHAQYAFAPQDIPTPPVVVRGPLFATPLDPPPPAPSPSPSSPATGVIDSSTPPQAPPAGGDRLPHASPPAEAQQPTGAGEVEAVSVRIELDDAEKEAAEKWNQERIERRLRGEYERMQTGLAEIVNENLDAPLRLNAIRILGATHTRPSFLSRIFAPYLMTLPPPSFLSSSFNSASEPATEHTLRSVLRTSQSVVDDLSEFDIFRTLNASIERPASVLAHPDEVDLVLRVTEAPKYFLRTATDVGDGEGSATATAKIRNAFGGGETVEGNLSFGTRTRNAFQLRFDTPILSSPTTRFDLTFFQAQRDLNWYASCTEGTKGFMARVRALNPYGLGVHEAAYEAVLRQVGEIAPGASLSIRNAAGPSVKSSLSHTFTHDTRDDPFLSTRGAFLKLKQEYAGLGGDASFVKAEGEGSLSRPLNPFSLPGWSYSLSARAGALFPFISSCSASGAKCTSLFSDRFHIGGPTSVRSFRPNAMGPKDTNDYVGGDVFYALGASLLAPMPFVPREKRGSWWETNLRSHFWLNAGKLIPSAASYSSLLSTPPSLTAGFGVMYRHSLVRIEANVGVPLVMYKGEGGVKGLQFGLGLSFL